MYVHAWPVVLFRAMSTACGSIRERKFVALIDLSDMTNATGQCERSFYARDRRDCRTIGDKIGLG